VSVDFEPDDGPAWDAFVQAADPGSYLQLRGWADVKRPNGWSATRVLAAAPDGPVGAQVLVRRLRPLPWSFAYAPRGPVAARLDAAAIRTFTIAARAALQGPGRVSHLRIDPEVELGGPLDPGGAFLGALHDAGWRPGAAIQPASTRLIDLRADEGALWSDLRKKWRQYVNRARTLGVTVADADGDELGTFYGIYRETAARAGFRIRTEAAYRDVWGAYRPLGLARLLIARLPDGEPAATLFLVRCGSRVTEVYGGMTAAGAESRANYLVKWEAIRSARAEGALAYDLWGQPGPGIAHFKSGFGGHEVRYVGAWDLVLDPLGHAIYRVGERARDLAAGRRSRRPGDGDAAPAGAAAGDAG
jgi:peptidoglycan pentaglycine glycine transferase (the first glycine)